MGIIFYCVYLVRVVEVHTCSISPINGSTCATKEWVAALSTGQVDRKNLKNAFQAVKARVVRFLGNWKAVGVWVVLVPLLGFAVTFRSNVTILSPKVEISYKMWWFSSTCCHRMPIRSPLLRMQGLWRVHERCACHSDRASFGSCKEGRKKSWSSMKGALDHLDFGHENRCYFWQTLQLDPALVWPVSSCEPSAGSPSKSLAVVQGLMFFASSFDRVPNGDAYEIHYEAHFHFMWAVLQIWNCIRLRTTMRVIVNCEIVNVFFE